MNPASFLLIGWLALLPEHGGPVVACPLMDDLAAPVGACVTLSSGQQGYAILQEPEGAPTAVLVRWPNGDLWVPRNRVYLKQLPPGSYIPPCMASYYAGEGCSHYNPTRR